MVDAGSAFNSTTFIVDLFILLSCAVLAGEIATRLGQAALVGQLLVGVILGPTLLGSYLGLTNLSQGLTAIQVLATVFILFMAGLDIVPEQIYRMGFSTVAMGIAVFAVPFGILAVLSRVLFPGLPTLTPLFIGLTLSITALPVMGILLIEFGIAKTRIGNLLISTALVNELTAVTVFAVLLQLQDGSKNGLLAIAVAALSVGVFIGTMLSIHSALRALRGSTWWETARERISDRWRTKEAGFALLMIGMIGASLYSQFMGLTFVVGAFYAGILVTEESAGPKAHEQASRVFDAMTWGFFIPLFFAFVGVDMNLRLLSTPVTVTVFVLLLVAAVLTKVGTGFYVARFFGWPRVDALAIGNLVNSRGAVELAMAVILLQAGVFTAQIFTIVAGIGLVTTFMAPIGTSWSWRTHARQTSTLEARAALLKPRPSTDPLPSYKPSLSFGIIQRGGLADAPQDRFVRPDPERSPNDAPPGAAAPLRTDPPPLPKAQRPPP
jgi:Kef-type K+ transport system membrane component KefB